MPDFPALASITPILGIASYVKLYIPVFGSTSHVNLERAPENATVITRYEIYYFILFLFFCDF
jgi:hypothetical protein